MSTVSTFEFREETHDYLLDGEPQPYVTGIMENLGIIYYGGVPQYTIERKGHIGSIVHRITEYVDRDGFSYDLATGIAFDEFGERIEGYDIAPEHTEGYCRAHAKFMRESDFQPELIEFRHVATVHGMRYGMTTDRTGIFNKKPHIIDFKCTAACEPWWGIQLAGYALGQPRPANVVRWERSMVWLQPTGNYSVMPGGHIKSDHVIERRDEETFLAALRISYWRRENLGAF